MGETKVDLVSVIIAVHGDAEWFREALDSVFQQTFKGWELICVLDKVSESVKQTIFEYPQSSRIRIIVLQENVGAASARNIALEAAKGKFIAVIDSDDIWVPCHLQTMIEQFAKNDALVLAGCSYQVIDENGEFVGPPHIVPKHLLRYVLLFKNVFLHSSVIYRKDAARAVGGYPSAVSLGEDYCLWLSLAQIGSVKNVSVVSVNYRRHINQTSRRVVDSVSADNILQGKLALATKLRIPRVIITGVNSKWLKLQSRT